MPLIATLAVGEAQDVREGGMKQRWRISVLKPDDLWIYKHPAWVLLRGLGKQMGPGYISDASSSRLASSFHI